MASIQERLKLKRAPTDIWSIREQLCLASSVLKSGDQNWMSVSRSLKPVADRESIRPPDWFSQKSCAQQYAYLLENADIPKRKKRESGETTSEFIVRRLTEDRISELSKTLTSQREEYQQIKNELSLLKNGIISDEKLQKMWLSIEQEEKEQEQKDKAHNAWLIKRQQNKESQSLQLLNVQTVQNTANDSSTESQEITEINNEDEEKRNRSGRSSLLTSLLKSPSPTIQVQPTTQATGSPTIASLLCTSPKVPGPIVIQNISSQLHQLVSSTAPSTAQERPSASAPTLSMLLEQPSTGTQRGLQQQLQSSNSTINTKNLQNSMQIHNTIQTRSARFIQETDAPNTQVQESISNADISEIISTPIDEVLPKVMPMDKDELNEIIGDIEELIKEEITGSPQTLELSPTNVQIDNNENEQVGTVVVMERAEPRNVDEPISLSNSPTSEISIEEIDSSTSNIAEIIGTAIGTVESKISVHESSKVAENVEESKSTVTSTGEIVKPTVSEELFIQTENSQETTKDVTIELDCKTEEILAVDNEPVVDEVTDKVKSEKVDNSTTKLTHNEKNDQELVVTNKKRADITESNTEYNEMATSKVDSSLVEKINDSPKQEEKSEETKDIKIDIEDEKSEQVCTDTQDEKTTEDNAFNDDSLISSKSEMEIAKDDMENVNESGKELVCLKDCNALEQASSNLEKEKESDLKEDFENSRIKNVEEKLDFGLTVAKETEAITDFDTREVKSESGKNSQCLNSETLNEVKNENIKSEEITLNDNPKKNPIFEETKIEVKKEDNETTSEECKQVKETVKREVENETFKKETIESIGNIEELDEEEPTLSKLSGGRAMKTYSKKQNATVDSEPENETGGETADYRAWKKSIMLVYNRLATHKYASIFLRPITEDQAPGYHSIIFRPMDLWTIKKNIDNGTIRSTTHFQRDVMLMFQNAIMFNKHNTLVHKMTLEMQEECLQHMQVLVRAAGEASFRRETRTAASISNEAADSGLKRKWTHITPNPHEIESSRIKKRRKSEND